MTPPLELEVAQSRLLALAAPTEIEHVTARDAAGRWLAAPLIAAHDRPALPTSAMDGYAVCADDLAGPWRIIGASAAGHLFRGRVTAGTAVRIATGAVVPDTAGAVIVQEDVERDGDIVRISGYGPARPALHIRQAGSDFRAGSTLIEAGARLTPAAVALALSSGRDLVPVRRPLNVALIDCGDELVTDPVTCATHQVAASNAAMLASLMAPLPVRSTLYGPVPDRIGPFLEALNTAPTADVIVTTGGASVGDHDITRPALERWGAELDFWRIAIKPGKPLLVARRGRQIVLGLPGNPVSAFVTAYFFLLPLIRSMSGAARCLPVPERLPLGVDLQPGGARREFLRGVIREAGAQPLSRQDSGGLLALAQATILIDRPARAAAAPAGEAVPVYRLENGGIA